MEQQEFLKEINSLKNEIKELKGSKNIYVPITVALVGLFGTIFGYFYTEYAKSKYLDKQTEYNFISDAINSKQSGREKINRLMFLANSGLIPQNEKTILEKLNQAVITPDNELLFLEAEANRIGSYNLYRLGIAMNNRGNFFDAAKVLEESIKNDSTNYWAYIALGYSYLQLEKYARVITISEIALKLDPYKRNAYANLKAAYTDLHNYPKACEYTALCLKYAELSDSLTNDYIKFLDEHGDGRLVEITTPK